jgi:hypothetical protein
VAAGLVVGALSRAQLHHVELLGRDIGTCRYRRMRDRASQGACGIELLVTTQARYTAQLTVIHWQHTLDVLCLQLLPRAFASADAAATAVQTAHRHTDRQVHS